MVGVEEGAIYYIDILDGETGDKLERVELGILPQVCNFNLQDHKHVAIVDSDSSVITFKTDTPSTTLSGFRFTEIAVAGTLVADFVHFDSETLWMAGKYFDGKDYSFIIKIQIMVPPDISFLVWGKRLSYDVDPLRF